MESAELIEEARLASAEVMEASTDDASLLTEETTLEMTEEIDSELEALDDDADASLAVLLVTLLESVVEVWAIATEANATRTAVKRMLLMMKSLDRVLVRGFVLVGKTKSFKANKSNLSFAKHEWSFQCKTSILLIHGRGWGSCMVERCRRQRLCISRF